MTNAFSTENIGESAGLRTLLERSVEAHRRREEFDECMVIRCPDKIDYRISERHCPAHERQLLDATRRR